MIIFDRRHPAQTAGLSLGSETVSLPESPCRACRLRTRAGPPHRLVYRPSLFGTQPTVYRTQAGWVSVLLRQAEESHGPVLRIISGIPLP